MRTLILPSQDPQTLEQAVQVLRSGGLVALPTDTVYGLGALVWDAMAVRKIYEVKGRLLDKAIPVLLGDLTDLSQVAMDIPAQVLILAQRFWPGPLTLVVPKQPAIPQVVSSGPTLGVRVPSHLFTRQLLRTSGPMAVTSANLSGREDASSAQEVLNQLDGRIPLIIDAGPVGQGQASTVVDCLSGEPVVLREGPITLDQIKAVLAG